MCDNITSVTNFRERSLWRCNKPVYCRPRIISRIIKSLVLQTPQTLSPSFAERARILSNALLPLDFSARFRPITLERPDIFLLSISTPFRPNPRNTITLTFPTFNLDRSKIENNPRNFEKYSKSETESLKSEILGILGNTDFWTNFAIIFRSLLMEQTEEKFKYSNEYFRTFSILGIFENLF